MSFPFNQLWQAVCLFQLYVGTQNICECVVRYVTFSSIKRQGPAAWVPGRCGAEPELTQL